MRVLVTDEDGKTVAILDPDAKTNCAGSGNGATSEMCGGCDACLLRQAEYSGFSTEYIDD